MKIISIWGEAMLRTAFWYAAGWVILVSTVPMLWRVRYLDAKGRTAERDRLADQMTVRICRVLFSLTGSKVRVAGQENVPESGAVLFVSNHQGYMDSVIIHGFVNKPKGFISIVEVLKIPILHTWMKYMQCVFLDRTDARQCSTAMSEAIETLKNGHSMVVFPEGRLSDGDEANEFQRGWLRLATKSGVPIVPVTISGSYKVLSKDGNRVGAATVECVISKPILVDNLKKTDEIEFIENLRARILAAKKVAGE